MEGVGRGRGLGHLIKKVIISLLILSYGEGAGGSRQGGTY